MRNLRSGLAIASFEYGLTLGVQHDLLLALRALRSSNIWVTCFTGMPCTTWNRLVKKNNHKQGCFPPETPLTILDLFDIMWSMATRFRHENQSYVLTKIKYHPHWLCMVIPLIHNIWDNQVANTCCIRSGHNLSQKAWTNSHFLSPVLTYGERGYTSDSIMSGLSALLGCWEQHRTALESILLSHTISSPHTDAVGFLVADPPATTWHSSWRTLV